MSRLSIIQRDVLCEMFNIGVGQSASALGSMLDDEVLLSVPEIRFITVSEAAEQLGKKSATMYCIREPFTGPFNGSALLVFPEEKSLDLVRKLIGHVVPGTELAAIQRDALLEVGNVVLNACISSLAEMIDATLECGVPAVDLGDTRRILGVRIQNHVVMLIHIRFELKEQNIE